MSSETLKDDKLTICDTIVECRGEVWCDYITWKSSACDIEAMFKVMEWMEFPPGNKHRKKRRLKTGY
jgi:hypothetical protein